MSRRAWWIAGFLTLTAAAVGAELLAAFDGSPDTVPWTDLLGQYVPWPVTAIAVLVLVLWLPVHLYRRYRYPPKEGIVTDLVKADARNRALRTFAQGLLVDVAAGVVLAVGPQLAGEHFAWTRAYWLAVGGLAAKTAVQTAVSYVARKVVPPPAA